MRRLKHQYALVFVMSVVAPALVAAETTVAPDVNVSWDHDSNRRLQLDNDDSVSGYVAEASVAIKNATPQWRQELTTQVQSRRYEGDYDLGSDDQNVSGTVRYHRQTSVTEVRASAINDTTLTDQLDFSGYTEELKRRHYLSTGLTHEAQLSPIDLWVLGYNIAAAKYTNAEDTNLIDYRFDTASTTFQHHFNQAIAGYLTASTSLYEARDAGNESDTKDVCLGSLWKFSEVTLMTIGVGKRKTSHSYFDDLFMVDDQFNYATFELSRELPSGNVTFKTQDLSQPTGDGSLYHVRKASLDYYTDISARQILSVSAAYSQQRASADQFASSDRDNSQLTVSYRYKLTSDIGLQIVGTYRDQKYLAVGQTVASNSLWLGVYWAPVPYRW